MATLRQKKLAKAIVENSVADKPLNKKELVVSSGYSEISAESSASTLIDSKGVKEELIVLGFDPDTAKKVVAEILQFGENDTVRLNAADKVFKVHGTYAAEKHLNVNIDVESTERSRELGNRLLGLLGR